ncbi:hypothetical protein [Phenylobacterium sp.]|uniref:hypothetical protein n=1 Tax=Phenylobacterium sp. TaxID=1871053 RepID=UPI0025EACAB0|nr:hypothetical protein [Phenylobacterium sp.]
MAGFFFSFWWLLFPIGFFVFGAWDRWLSYQRSKDRLDLLRTYTAQGKDPPPELLRALREDEIGDAPPGAPPFDPYDRYSRRYARRYYRGYWRSGPYGAWRGAIVTGAVAAGFWFTAEYADVPGLDWPFRLVAIIMTCVAVGNLAVAVLATVFRGR